MKSKFLLLIMSLLGFIRAYSWEYKEITHNGIKYILYYANKQASIEPCSYFLPNSSNNYVTGNVVIPETIYYNNIGYRVTSIGYGAFTHCDQLESMELPNSIKEIGGHAFFKCKRLKSVNIPENVQIICEESFYGSGITELKLPSSVKTIKERAFADCSSLQSIVVDESNQFFDSRNGSNAVIDKQSNTLLFGCSNSQIPYGINTIGASAFEDCKGGSGKTIVIPPTVTTIKERAFFCSDFGNIQLSNGLLTIEANAFFMTQITNIIFPKTLKCISNEAFKYSRLKTVSLPENIQVIGHSAFYGCSNLQSIIMPQNLEVIYPSLCGECTSLSNVELPVELKTISSGAFGGCKNLKTIELFEDVIYENDSFDESTMILKSKNITINGVTYTTYNGNQACVYSCLNQITSVTINDVVVIDQQEYKVTAIKKNAFKYPTQISTIILPSDITYIGMNTFSNSSSIYAEAGSRSLLAAWNAGFVPHEINSDSLLQKPNIISSNISSTAVDVEIKNIYPGYQCLYYFDGTEIDIGEGLYHITGLDPLSPHTFYLSLSIKDEYGREWAYSKYNQFQTLPLVLTTNSPKTISVGDVVVSALSNIDDEESNVGFEWRRTDWADNFPSNYGIGYIYEGCMEGYIRNLNANYLWIYRPYYESDSGTRYYGEWVGIDPSNTSFFEPTVHTYAKILVEGNEAVVKGYALRGTDGVTTQGFKYWKNEAGVKYKSNVQQKTIVIPADAMMVQAAGQVMTASLIDLDYNAEYCVVAFMSTTEGEIFYGEMQMFKTGKNPEVLPGDVNSDGKVDLTDAIMIVYHSLGQSPSGFNKDVADVNSDGAIDITDAIIVVYKNLGVVSSPAVSEAKVKSTLVGASIGDELIISDVTVPQGGTVEVPLDFKAAEDGVNVGFTCNLILPEGITTVKDEDGVPENDQKTSVLKKFTVISTENDGFAAIPQTTSATIKGTGGTLMTFQLQADESLQVGTKLIATVTKAAFTAKDAEGKMSTVALDDFTFTITVDNPTGIGSLNRDERELAGAVYDLSGRKVVRIQQKGIYVRDGKKVVVK